MSIDKFGRRFDRTGVGVRGPPGLGFKFTDDGHFNVDFKQLKNIVSPTDELDACTKIYVDNLMKNSLTYNTQKLCYDATDRRLSNIGYPQDPTDAVTKNYVVTAISKFLVEISNTVLMKNKNTDDEKSYFDGQLKRICRVSAPIKDNDVSNKYYVDAINEQLTRKIDMIINNLPAMIISEIKQTAKTN